jgi:hypothetical protein
MPRSATEHPEKFQGPNLLQEFENSLPDFKNLDEEQHRKFVRAIRLLCRYFHISETRLRRDHLFKLRSPASVSFTKSIMAKTQSLHQRYCLLSCTSSRTILMVKTRI